MKGSPMEMLLLKKDVSDKLEDLATLCPPALPDQINKKVMFIQGSVLLGSLESGASTKPLTAFMDKRPRNREPRECQQNDIRRIFSCTANRSCTSCPKDRGETTRDGVDNRENGEGRNEDNRGKS